MTLSQKEPPFERMPCVNEKEKASLNSPSLWARVKHSINSRGLIGTLSLVPKNILWAAYRWRDSRFDRRYGVDTSGLVGLQSVSVVGDSIEGSNYYAPAPVKTIQRIFSALSIDPKQYDFADIGTGKGRPALLASMAGFRRVIGVEFSPELADIAKRNAVQFRSKAPDSTEVQIVCEDATTWRIPAEDCVLFMFNPFDEPVMRQFLENVARSFEEHGQHILLAYYHPTCVALLHEAPFLSYKSYTVLPFDPTPENTFEVEMAGAPYDLAVYETVPSKIRGA